MFTLPSMSQIIAWFGWGNGIGAVAAISVILTLVVIVAPVIAGLLLYGLERAQVEIIGAVNRDFAYFFREFLDVSRNIRARDVAPVLCRDYGG